MVSKSSKEVLKRSLSRKYSAVKPEGLSGLEEFIPSFICIFNSSHLEERALYTHQSNAFQGFIFFFFIGTRPDKSLLRSINPLFAKRAKALRSQ